MKHKDTHADLYADNEQVEVDEPKVDSNTEQSKDRTMKSVWRLLDKHSISKATRQESGKQRLGSVRHDFCLVYINQHVTSEYTKKGYRNPEPVRENTSGYLKRLLDSRREVNEPNVESAKANKGEQPFVKFTNSLGFETALCLDFDDLTPSGAEHVLRSLFSTPYQCIGNTTSTTTVDRIKLHLCFPLAHAVEPGTVRARIQAFCDRFRFSEYVDRKCLSAQRGWYIPTKHVVTPRVFVHGEGRRWLDISEYMPSKSAKNKKTKTTVEKSKNTADYSDFDKVIGDIRDNMLLTVSKNVVEYLTLMGCSEINVTPHRSNSDQFNVSYLCPELHRHDSVQVLNLSGVMHGEGCRSDKCSHRPKPHDFDFTSEVTSMFFSRVVCFHLKGSTRRFWLVGDTVYTDSMVVSRLQRVLCGGVSGMINHFVSRLRLPEYKHSKSVQKKMRTEVNSRMSVIMQGKKTIHSQQVTWNDLELPMLDNDMQSDIWDAFTKFDTKTKLDSPYIHVLDDRTFDMANYGRPFNCYPIDGNNWKLIPVRGGRDGVPQDKKTSTDDRLGIHDILMRSGYLAAWTFSDMVSKLKKLSFAVTVHPKPDFDSIERQLCRQRIFLASARGCHVIVQSKKGFNRDTNSLQSFLNIAHRCRSSKPKLNALLASEQDPLLDIRARYATSNLDMFRKCGFKIPDMAHQYVDGKLVDFKRIAKGKG